MFLVQDPNYDDYNPIWNDNFEFWEFLFPYISSLTMAKHTDPIGPLASPALTG